MENLRWIATAALSAYAGHLAVRHATPVDQALPLLALAVTFVAWLSRRRSSSSGLMLAVPLLIAAEVALPVESVRLLTFGAIVAVCLGIALSTSSGPEPAKRGEGSPDSQRSMFRGGSASLGITVVALLLLRWIPFADVLLLRELVLLALAVAIAIVLGRTPFAVMVAVITALATPAVPLRTLALPAAVLLVAVVARLFGTPRIALMWPSTVILMYVMLFFPWSGVVARAFPYFLQREMPPRHRSPIAQALAPNRSAKYEVPDGARSLVVSGANVASLRRGAILGRVEPGGIAVRIGDAADWGYMRREHFYAARNPLPRDPAGRIREYGYAAWADGAGRMALPRGARTIRITASENLAADASLQVEGFE